MATFAGKNFSHRQPAAENGDRFERCNLSQLVPGTAVCAGVTGLTFVSCNLVNCAVPGDAVVENCNTTQVSRCKHLHPEWTPLPDEPDNCPHVVSTDTLEPGGITVYHREDTVL